MGIVYRALDIKLNREVALKVLPPDLVADPERKRRLVQEAQAAAALEHPHIAVVYEIDEAEGATFIAMELIQGEKLSELLQSQSLPLARLLEIATEIAEGLASAHERGIVHRDLKPANVMVTEQGHAKIIDFGVAKLLRPLAGDETDEVTAVRLETDPGLVMGTVSYMSPEQARGGKVDHRTDVFAFGVCLYEMVTRVLPFRGTSAVETLNAIIHSTPPTVGQPSGMGREVAADLQRVLDKSLAKDPAERYQTMRDLAIDLRHTRRRLESGTVSALPSVGTPSRIPWVAAAAALVGALALGAFLLRPTSENVRSSASSKPSVAVLYFDNVTGDPSLDWLHTGLADMLVTDLSQSPRLEVLSTDRLYQILKEMNRLDDRVTSLDVVQEVAEKAGVEIVVLGSFMKSGENVRINIRIQEAASGKILTSEKVEGVGDDSIFPMVDDLTRRVMARLDVSPTEDASDRRLEEVTTASVEAFRFYSEGMKLHYELKEEEALLLFEKAVEVDPEFAMALARLAIVHSNLGHEKEEFEFSSRAVAHADRLTPKERWYIEGNFYARREETYARAIEIYENALAEDASQEAIRNNVALRLWFVELYDRTIEHLERVRGKTEFLGSYGTLASAYSAQGRLDEGDRVLKELVARRPDSAPAYRYLGFHHYRAGRLEDARAAFARERALDPASSWPDVGLAQVANLAEDWQEARNAASNLTGARNPFFQWLGHIGWTSNALTQGRTREALESLDAAARTYPEPNNFVGASESYAANLLVELGRYREAIERADRARQFGEGDSPEWDGLFFRALAEQRLDRATDADETLRELERRTSSIPGPKATRRVHWLAGELALLRGDTARALEKLTRAESMLAPRGFPGPDGPPAHVPIWYALGSAHMATGNEEEAIRWFGRVSRTAHEHFDWPIPYVRSFYFLGTLHESRGESKEAKDAYRRFVDAWGEGDVDRERIEEARKKL
jgi:serine/threonine protein kinase/tetratricopeptide (TPR) repeat protein